MGELDLHKNTISEFHDNLMVFYELCKKEQAKHVGYYVKSLQTIEIPVFDVKKDTIEDRTILRDKNWGTKTKWRDYMKSKGYNNTV